MAVARRKRGVALKGDGRITARLKLPYQLTGARIECKGTHYLCGMGLDISVRHQQEQQLRLRERALHAASNGIVITRCSGKDNPIEYVNPAC